VANAPFLMPVLALMQNITDPFPGSSYNFLPTAPIVMTEIEDASGNLFANRTETPATSIQKTITLSNFHPSPLKIKTIMIGVGRSYTVDPVSSCEILRNNNTNLSAGTGLSSQNCQIVVNFNPRTEVSAVLNDLLVVEYEYLNSYSGVNAQVRARIGHKLDGFGTTSKTTLVNANVNFSAVPIMATDDQTITITNSGTETISISSLDLGTGFSSAFTVTSNTCTGASLIAAATCQIGVRFQPGSAGTFNNTIKVNYAGSMHTTSRSVTYSLSGVGNE
jgi:hypothetical protein